MKQVSRFAAPSSSATADDPATTLRQPGHGGAAGRAGEYRMPAFPGMTMLFVDNDITSPNTLA
jgi:hypothetical protein